MKISVDPNSITLLKDSYTFYEDYVNKCEKEIPELELGRVIDEPYPEEPPEGLIKEEDDLKIYKNHLEIHKALKFKYLITYNFWKIPSYPISNEWMDASYSHDGEKFIFKG